VKMRVIIPIAFIVLVAVILWIGYGIDAAPVPFSKLVSEPERYNGRTVTVEAIYVNDGEEVLLTEYVAYIGTGDARELKPVGDSIWFEGPISQEIQDQLYKITNPAGETACYGKLKVAGVFETKGKYGPANRFKYRLTVKTAALLDWTPPE
jgi:hypothetical protein